MYNYVEGMSIGRMESAVFRGLPVLCVVSFLELTEEMIRVKFLN